MVYIIGPIILLAAIGITLIQTTGAQCINTQLARTTNSKLVMIQKSDLDGHLYG